MIKMKTIDLRNFIKKVEDYPKKGIKFRDITPLLQNGEAYEFATRKLLEFAKEKKPTVIVGPEARGFIFGCPIANHLKIGFIPIRKPNKLPRKTIDITYDLEYGTNSLSMHYDAIKKGDRVLVIDDLLATGGTVKATIELVEKQGGIIVGCVFLIRLKDLKGTEKINAYPYKFLLEY